jgi:Zn-dependent protease
MKGSLRIARIAGIDVRVHFTFVFILMLGAMQFGGTQGMRGALFGVVSVLSLFFCVTLHELGHSLVAQHFGVRVREILLLPIGGLARLLREPTRPLHELLIALAGPLVNVVIACVLYGVLRSHHVEWDDSYWVNALEHPDSNALLSSLFLSNVSLAAFNLLPALPMDGGRVLRAVLSFFLVKRRATIIAATVGQVLALGLAALGVASNMNLALVLIGAFVFFGATEEKAASRAGEVLSELSAGEVCCGTSDTLSPADVLGDVVDHSLRSAQTTFPVVYGSDLIGLVLREEAMNAAMRLGLRASVAHVIRRDLPVCAASTPLVEVRDRIAETGLPVVVVDGQRLLGVLSAEDVVRISRVSARLAQAGIHRPQPIASDSASASPPAV